MPFVPSDGWLCSGVSLFARIYHNDIPPDSFVKHMMVYFGIFIAFIQKSLFRVIGPILPVITY